MSPIEPAVGERVFIDLFRWPSVSVRMLRAQHFALNDEPGHAIAEVSLNIFDSWQGVIDNLSLFPRSMYQQDSVLQEIKKRSTLSLN